MSELWQTVKQKMERESYRPDHSLQGYCDACNLPGCLRSMVDMPADAENPFWNYLRGPDNQWEWENDHRKVKRTTKT